MTVKSKYKVAWTGFSSYQEDYRIYCLIRYQGNLIRIKLSSYGAYLHETNLSGKPGIKIGSELFTKMLKKKPHIKKSLAMQIEEMDKLQYR